MQPSILIGVAAGFASAVLAASAIASGGGGGSFLLSLLTPLPVFLAGLGWGTAAGFSAALGLGVGCGLLLGPLPGLLLFLTQALPVALLCHLAQLGRTGTGPGGQPAVVEWYPVGHMLAIAAVTAALLAFVFVYAMGGDLDTLRSALRERVEKFFELFQKEFPDLFGSKPTDADLAAMTEKMIFVLPAMTALSILAGQLLNFYLAGRVTLASGRLPRPWPDLAAMRFPRGFGMALAAALALSATLQGVPTLLASAFAGAFLFAYLLMGLAVIHHATRGMPARALVLVGVYLALVLLNAYAGVALALLGLLEPVLPWRRRADPPAPPT